LDKLIDDRQHKLIQDLQDASVEIDKLRTQVQAASEKLLYTGAVKAQMKRGGVGPELTIYRKTEAGPVGIPATEDAEILPGDVIDVIIRPDKLVMSPGR
jgi:polysaccharide export outer membrane protein